MEVCEGERAGSCDHTAFRSLGSSAFCPLRCDVRSNPQGAGMPSLHGFPILESQGDSVKEKGRGGTRCVQMTGK